MTHSATIGALLAATLPLAAQAQQTVAFDKVYQATGSNNFHFDVKPAPDQPASWVSPVDYSKGTVYIHQEVFTKPSNRDTVVDICFDGDLAGYGCIDTLPYKTTGVHETMKPLNANTMYQYGKVAWTKKRTLFQLVIKDPALGGTPGGKPATDFVPSDMRIVLTVVAPGGTYTPPAPMSPVDGGEAPPADAGSRPEASPDLTVPPDASPATADAMVPVTVPIGPDAAAPAPSGGTTPPAPAPAVKASSAGCAVGGSPAPPAGLLAVALVLLLRRRRHDQGQTST
jgi:MYXO-CTERM domain-containing protein